MKLEQGTHVDLMQIDFDQNMAILITIMGLQTHFESFRAI